MNIGVFLVDERFLFPFEKVPRGSTILIYGAGELGQSYLRQVMLSRYCNVAGMIDKNYSQYGNTSVPVCSPSQIKSQNFDFVVVALKSRGSFSEVRRILQDAGISNDKIIYIGKRDELPWQFSFRGELDDTNGKLAFQLGTPSIALFLLASIGGFIFIKKFIEEIIRMVPECIIDIYFSRYEEPLRYLYSDIPNINVFIYNLGTKYSSHEERYDLALRVTSVGLITVDNYKPENFLPKYQEFSSKMNILQSCLQKEEYKDYMPLISLYADRRFHGKNCYTSFGYGVLDICDKTVSVPLDENAKISFEKMGLKHYITVNFGNGACKDVRKVAKAWPLERFKKTIALFKARYPKVEVVQLGEIDTAKIEGADHYILGEPFALVAHILKNAIFHFDIEGALVHLATQLGSKCIVLFGPTPEFFYGYEENINVKAGDCHDCCGVYLDSSRCARGLREPECMYSITPEMVMERITAYLKSLQIGEEYTQ